MNQPSQPAGELTSPTAEQDVTKPHLLPWDESTLPTFWLDEPKLLIPSQAELMSLMSMLDGRLSWTNGQNESR